MYVQNNLEHLCYLGLSQDILVYDIGNDLWYKQKASGVRVPENRRRFCAGAAWADDRSSYNISVDLSCSVEVSLIRS